jgi:hypothetical protein
MPLLGQSHIFQISQLLLIPVGIAIIQITFKVFLSNYIHRHVIQNSRQKS